MYGWKRNVAFSFEEVFFITNNGIRFLSFEGNEAENNNKKIN